MTAYQPAQQRMVMNTDNDTQESHGVQTSVDAMQFGKPIPLPTKTGTYDA